MTGFLCPAAGCVDEVPEGWSWKIVHRYGVEEPYEKLKAFTRGQAVTQASMRDFVAGIEGLPAHAKAELAALTPGAYTGNAAAQAHGLAADLSTLLD